MCHVAQAPLLEHILVFQCFYTRAMSWRKLHLSLAECGSAFSLSVCDGMLEAELRAAVAARLGALAGCERAATDLSWYLTLDGGDGAVVPLSPALPDGTRLLPEGWADYVSAASGPQPEGRGLGYGAGW